MTDDRDPILQAMFAEADQTLDGEVFAAQVMAQSRRLWYRPLAGWVGIALLMLALVTVLSVPLLEFGQLLSQVLTRSLIDLGGSWVSWLLAPINNIASLLVITGKMMRVGWKKIRSASYVS